MQHIYILFSVFEDSNALYLSNGNLFNNLYFIFYTHGNLCGHKTMAILLELFSVRADFGRHNISSLMIIKKLVTNLLSRGYNVER